MKFTVKGITLETNNDIEGKENKASIDEINVEVSVAELPTLVDQIKHETGIDFEKFKIRIKRDEELEGLRKELDSEAKKLGNTKSELYEAKEKIARLEMEAANR